MNTRMKLMLLCLLAGTAIAKTDVPKRDYKIVNFDNGITSRILEIGTTSVIFSVEWPVDADIPSGTMFLMGKLNIETDCWSFLGDVVIDPTSQMARVYGEDYVKRTLLEADQTKGKAMLEIPYTHLPWYDDEVESKMFAQKAFFSVQMPVDETVWMTTWGADGWATNGVVDPPINAPSAVTAEATVQEQAQTTQGGTPAKVGMANKQDEADAASTPHQPTSSRWLYYLGLLLGTVCTALYFLRKKKT